MKKVTLSILFFALLQFSFGQEYFLKSYNSAQYSSSDASSILQTSDDGFIFTGRTGLLGGVYIVKTDSKGDTLWTKILTNQEEDKGYKIVESHDGGYIICGRVLDGSWGSDAYIAKINAGGDLIWEKTLEGNSNENIKSIALTTDGKYVLVGKYGDANLGQEAWILNMDEAGDTAWTIKFGCTSDDYANAIIANQEGGFIGGGAITDTASYTTNMLLFKMDATGDTLWTKSYGGPNNETCVDIDTTVDGGYLMLGIIDIDGFGNEDILLTKTNSNGDSLWSKTYGKFNRDRASDIIHSGDGGYYILSTSYSYGGGSADLYLLKVDASGDSLWSANYGAGQDETNNAIIPTSDGGLAICGNTQNLESYLDAYIFKLDAGFNTQSVKGYVQGDTTYCIGGSTNLSIDIDGVYYNWNSFDNEKEITVNSPGKYWAKLENFMGISDYSDTVEVYEIPLPIVDVFSRKDTLICLGETTSLIPVVTNDNGKDYTYNWTNIGIADSITSDTAGSFSVEVTDAYNCKASDNIKINFTQIPDGTNLCNISYNVELNRMVITMKETNQASAEYYTVYRQESGNFEAIGSVPVADSNAVIDTALVPEVKTYRYKVAVTDTCGNESELSNFHLSMRMAVTNNESINLSWSSYFIEGETYAPSSYTIYRGDTTTNMQPYITVDSITTTYIDTSAEAKLGKYYYMIAANMGDSCQLTDTTYSTMMFTNTGNNGWTPPVVSVNNNELLNIKAYPIPFTNEIHLSGNINTIDKISIQLFDVTGNLLHVFNNSGNQNHITLNTSSLELESGMYFIKINTQNHSQTLPVLKQ